MGIADDLFALKKSLTDKAALVKQVALLAKKYIAEDIDEKVVKATPVDTGLARSNWIVSLRAPFDDVIPAYFEGSGLGVDEIDNAAAAILQAKTVLDGVVSGDVVYIQNNVDYIGLLNSGSSQQAPSLFVELAIKDGIESGLQRLQALAAKVL